MCVGCGCVYVCVIKNSSLTLGVPKSLAVRTCESEQVPVLSLPRGMSHCCPIGSSTENLGSCFLGSVMVVVSLLLGPQQEYGERACFSFMLEGEKHCDKLQKYVGRIENKILLTVNYL